MTKKLSFIIRHFEVPIKLIAFKGKVHKDAWYRFGNSGDPCMDWAHSEELVEKYKFINFFCVTKLQTLKGFTGFFNKLQVSVDPFNAIHFKHTLKNVETILKKYPQVKIVLRIRSVSTTNKEILSLLDTAVKFANKHNLPVMETRMRFNKKEAVEKYALIEKNYERRKDMSTRPKYGQIFLENVEKYYDCDLYGKKCLNCSNCTLLWTDTQYKKKGEFIAPR